MWFVFALVSLCACTAGTPEEEQTEHSNVDETTTWQEQYDLGSTYLSEENYDEAIAAFTVATKIDPTQADAYLELAKAHTAQGGYSQRR